MNTTEITTEKGILRIWEAREGCFSWGTPNGSEGSDESSFEEAAAQAFDAEGLKAEDYGY